MREDEKDIISAQGQRPGIDALIRKRPRMSMGIPKGHLRVAIYIAIAMMVLIEALGFMMRGSGVEGIKYPDKLDKKSLARKNKSITESIAYQAPDGIYVLVDTGRNRLYLMNGKRLAREAVVSCGSGNILDDPNGKKSWVFDTPRGEFRILSKVENPVWVKPDWAFIEEGESLPKRYNERLDPGAMGDYALGLGDGYFIHGTLYKTLLGRNVTHGCVRVGDDDLEAVFKAVSIGTKVIIF